MTVEDCTARTPQRNLWIDFLRGVVLLVVLIDHVEFMVAVPLLGQWTLQGIGFSDAGESFIFISGYTFGKVYSGRLAHLGGLAILTMALSRSRRIYLWLLATLGTVFAISYPFRDHRTLEAMLNLGHPFSEQFGCALLLLNQPYPFGILPLYIVLIPFGAMYLTMHQRSRWLAIPMTVGIYLIPQFLPNAQPLTVLPELQSWHFNPLAWQIIYCAGITLGSTQGMKRHKHWAWLFLSIPVLAFGFAWAKSNWMPWGNTKWLEEIVDREIWAMLTHRRNLGAVRIMHFACVAWLTGLLSEKLHWLAKTLPGRQLVCWGQNPLQLYCVGLVLTYLAVPLSLFAGRSNWGVLQIHFDLIFVYVVVSSFLARYQARKLSMVKHCRIR